MPKHKDQKDVKEFVIQEYIINKKTYPEMCALLNISPNAFHELLKRLDIPARKVGKRYKKK